MIFSLTMMLGIVLETERCRQTIDGTLANTFPVLDSSLVEANKSSFCINTYLSDVMCSICTLGHVICFIYSLSQTQVILLITNPKLTLIASF